MNIAVTYVSNQLFFKSRNLVTFCNEMIRNSVVFMYFEKIKFPIKKSETLGILSSAGKPFVKNSGSMPVIYMFLTRSKCHKNNIFRSSIITYLTRKNFLIQKKSINQGSTESKEYSFSNFSCRFLIPNNFLQFEF